MSKKCHVKNCEMVPREHEVFCDFHLNRPEKGTFTHVTKRGNIKTVKVETRLNKIDRKGIR